MVYNVSEMLEDLDGHELDTVIKIKLNDGTIKEIAGFQFINGCIGGDNIIYIKEENQLKQSWGKGITNFLRLADKIMVICEEEYQRELKEEGDDADPCDILDIMNGVAKIADFYIDKCNLGEKVKEEYGFYEHGAGDTDEVYAKIYVLKNFMNI